MCRRQLFFFFYLFSFTAFILLFGLFLGKPVYAVSKTSYYDFGPYYSDQRQVLGITLSSLEQLPVIAIPQNVLPPTASGILPGSPLHPFEKLAENVQLAFMTDPVKKEEMRLNIAAERLSEAKTLVEQKQYDQAIDAASSYQDTMEQVVENLETLKKNNVSGVDNLAVRVENAAASNTVAAQSLAFSSPPSVADTWNTIVNAGKDSMDAAADVLNKPPIPEDLSSSIQELKNQGIITPEQSDKLYGFDRRRQVREELDKLMTSGQFPVAEIARLDQAVATNYPDVYKETVDVLRFAELRTYQTYPKASAEITKAIEEWKDRGDKNVPPPPEIRPYLYTERANDLAKKIDFNNFTPEQQTDVAKFYPQAIEENTTFQISPTPIPSPALTVTPVPTGETGQQEISPVPTSIPTPTPTPLTAEPYLTAQSGALPGDTAYFLKQFGEQFNLATTFDQAKRMELSMRFAEERFREANALSRNKDRQKEYEETLKRYQETFESVSKDIKNFKGDEEDKKDIAEKLRIEAARHNIVLEKGLLPPPVGKSEAFSKTIEATENAMDRSADALSLPVLPPSLTNRLQDLKAQGLILPEEVDELTKADSREEARDNIRKLTKLGTFPPADAKKLDDGQALVSPKDFNQLVEVRKIEELQRLRAVQTDFAQTATLKQTNESYAQRLGYLQNTIDTSMIRPEDLAGREELLKAYESLISSSSKRPINGGQFGDILPETIPSITSAPPERRDAVLSTCPVGAVFKQFEGCVWGHNGKKINDYDQYRCGNSREYWSFAAQKCVAYTPGEGRGDDVSPLCPVGYTWEWQSQSCQTSAGGIFPFPSPTLEPTPSSDKEIEERSKSCPTGSSYKAPQGCVWDDNKRSVYDYNQYKCGRGEYFSFENFKCVPAPKTDEALKDDALPKCNEPNTTWSWTDSRCVSLTEPVLLETTSASTLSVPKPNFALPDSPFYFLKRTVEAVQNVTAFSEQAKQEVRLAQAEERFAESYYLLEKKNEGGFKKSLADYTSKMQEIYNNMPKIEKLNDASKKALGEKLADSAVEQNLLLQKATVLASADITTPINAAVSMTVQGIDRASDLKGEPPIPSDIKTKIEAMPEDMITDAEKKKILDVDNRIEARIKLGGLIAVGALTQTDLAVFDKEIKEVDTNALIKLDELKKLGEIVELEDKKEKLKEKVEKNEEIVKKLDEFQKTFEPGKEVPTEIRPYVRLTRIEEVAQTIRPDIVNLSDFGNRKDVQLAVATLQEEFKPTREAVKKLEDFRRNNPGRPLPFELARIEALATGLGIRSQAESCFLPTPPFPPNTPCPAPGAAIPISSYYAPSGSNQIIGWYGSGGVDNKALTYGEGPKSTSTGSCPDGYHWMYDNGGWCMSNSGNYSSSYTSNAYTPTGSGYTPYSSYYTAPGASIGTSVSYPYSPPSYYGSAPTYYTTNPPAGTVPGTGPASTSPGQCPSGFHWMPPTPNQAGWCMADGNTYVPFGSSTSYPSGTYYSPNLTQSSCGPGYYWDGKGCIPTYSGGSSTTYYSGGSGSSTNNYCQGISCGSGSYLDYSTCSCKASYSGPSSSPSAGCSNYPSGGCAGSGAWFDWGSCSCRTGSTTSTGSYSSGYNPSSGSCSQQTCRSGEWFDWGTCSCRPSGNYYSGTTNTSGSTSTSTSGSTGTSTSTSGSGSTTTSGGSSGCSCPSGYHCMDNSWCMADGATTTSPSTSTTTAPTPNSGSTSTTTSTSTPDSGSSSTTTSSPPPPVSGSTSTSTTTTSPPSTDSPPPAAP